MADLKDTVSNLKKNLLANQVHKRKYNLLIYGLDDYESTTEDCIKRVRDFAANELKMEGQKAREMHIRNVHRLQRRNDTPTPIIVVFSNWTELDEFSRAGIGLK